LPLRLFGEISGGMPGGADICLNMPHLRQRGENFWSMDMVNFELSCVEYGIDDLSGYDQYAGLDVGSYGTSSDDPAFSAGDDQGEEVWGYQVWDSNTNGSTSSGFDTGQVQVAFTGDIYGNESLTVGSDSPVTYAGDSYSSISFVQLQAAVQVPATASWSNVSIVFYSGTQPVETDIFPTGPTVDTTSTPSMPAAEQFLFVCPSAANVTKFSVKATMRMTSPNPNPGPSDMFCNISIYG
jgi:hypothetical protein